MRKLIGLYADQSDKTFDPGAFELFRDLSGFDTGVGFVVSADLDFNVRSQYSTLCSTRTNTG